MVSYRHPRRRLGFPPFSTSTSQMGQLHVAWVRLGLLYYYYAYACCPSCFPSKQTRIRPETKWLFFFFFFFLWTRAMLTLHFRNVVCNRPPIIDLMYASHSSVSDLKLYAGHWNSLRANKNFFKWTDVVDPAALKWLLTKTEFVGNCFFKRPCGEGVSHEGWTDYESSFMNYRSHLIEGSLIRALNAVVTPTEARGDNSQLF